MSCDSLVQAIEDRGGTLLRGPLSTDDGGTAEGLMTWRDPATESLWQTGVAPSVTQLRDHPTERSNIVVGAVIAAVRGPGTGLVDDTSSQFAGGADVPESARSDTRLVDDTSTQ